MTSEFPEYGKAAVIGEENGTLTVLAQNGLPFEVKRVFCVTTELGAVRGNHAHIACNQFLVVLHGEVQVTVDDGSVSKEFTLRQVNEYILIPPFHWAKQETMSTKASLLVLCDSEFSEADYIRDYAQFLEAAAHQLQGSYPKKQS